MLGNIFIRDHGISIAILDCFHESKSVESQKWIEKCENMIQTPFLDGPNLPEIQENQQLLASTRREMLQFCGMILSKRLGVSVSFVFFW